MGQAADKASDCQDDGRVVHALSDNRREQSRQATKRVRHSECEARRQGWERLRWLKVVHLERDAAEKPDAEDEEGVLSTFCVRLVEVETQN